MRRLVALLVLLPRLALADVFGPQDNARIQQALVTLGYSLSVIDGQWGQATGAAVRHYRFDFGLSDATTLSATEAGQLIERASWLNAPVDTRAFYFGTNPDFRDRDEASFREGAYFEPQSLLYASPLHMLTAQIGRPSTFTSDALSYDVRRDWATYGRKRLHSWLSADLARNSSGDAAAIQRAILNIDLALANLDIPPSREDMLKIVLPNLQFIHEHAPAASLPPQTNVGISERLFRDLGKTLHNLGCRKGVSIEDRWVQLALDITNRYDALYPNSPHRLGYVFDIAKCADPGTRAELLNWRSEEALKTSDPFTAFDTVAQTADVFWSFSEEDIARDLYRIILTTDLPSLADRQKRLIERNSDRLVSLGMTEIVGPYLLSKLDALRGRSIASRADHSNALYLTTSLMLLGYGPEVTDRVFFDTDNDWRDDGNLFEFYEIMLRSIINDGKLEEALPLASALADRARVEGAEGSAQAFDAREIELLLDLGRYSEAEQRILEFQLIPLKGPKDPQVLQWRSRLNLATEEGVSIGRAYAQQIASFADKICGDTGDEDVSVYAPTIDRQTAYADPEFVVAARELNLGTRIAQCQGREWAKDTLSRTGCYLWTKDGDMTALQMGMQRWWAQQTIEARAKGLQIQHFAGMDCPVGIAEAGRSDLIAHYAQQTDPNTQAIGFQLLRLSAGLSVDSITPDRLDNLERPDGIDALEYPVIEIAGRTDHWSRARRRDAAFYRYEYLYSGAGMDNAEWAAIKAMSFNLASGYAALGLNEIALMFLEGGGYDVPSQIDAAAESKNSILDNAEMSRFALARGRLALKQGDAQTALGFSRPVLAAFTKRVRRGDVGSIEDLGAWSRRLHDFAELYLAALATSPDKLAIEPPQSVIEAQQIYAAATSASSAGRLGARLASSAPDLARSYQDALKDWRGAMQTNDNTRILALRNRVIDLRRELARRDPAFGASAQLSILWLDKIRGLAGGHVLIVTTSLPDHLLVNTIRPRSSDLRAIPLPREVLASQIDRFRATIQAEGDVATPEGIALSQAMLAGLSTEGLPEALSIVVDGPLVRLPMGALPLMQKGKRSYLGAETALSILPALSTIIPRAQGAKSHASRPFLGIGDTRVSLSGGLAHFGFAPPELRETNAELRYMGVLLGADIEQDLILGPTATEARVRQMSQSGDLARYRIITFATHGFIEGKGRITEPGLMLSEPPLGDRTQDGLLGASEIYTLRLDADLVLLSACDTAAVQDSTRGLSDLVRAFTYAGARSLIVTHWEIDTHAAMELARHLATQMKQNPEQSAAESLRDSVRVLLDTPTAARFHAPKYWASHTVIGY
ncbi:CHAT domain-containing protein [Paenirhodobacter sp. CAU 1674]|uniref:CHAT domain-containing protein n=1 Tax=Paenirhodobacter sp. CAU 1674 TaxID=3032596 RepID=UPI0023DB24D2|nr:CHAT domain-containing protein [Paenirhodobacter sp. CAU 1674]MDF2143271.1 CHAT domain-containing protein [Paenirhodobacter sp. CAU 1674]